MGVIFNGKGQQSSGVIELLQDQCSTGEKYKTGQELIFTPVSTSMTHYTNLLSTSWQSLHETEYDIEIE